MARFIIKSKALCPFQMYTCTQVSGTWGDQWLKIATASLSPFGINTKLDHCALICIHGKPAESRGRVLCHGPDHPLLTFLKAHEHLKKVKQHSEEDPSNKRRAFSYSTKKSGANHRCWVMGSSPRDRYKAVSR